MLAWQCKTADPAFAAAIDSSATFAGATGRLHLYCRHKHPAHDDLSLYGEVPRSGAHLAQRIRTRSLKGSGYAPPGIVSHICETPHFAFNRLDADAGSGWHG